jgi:ADP-ribose pyrophosphatase YjhB (NUDIX family)
LCSHFFAIPQSSIAQNSRRARRRFPIAAPIAVDLNGEFCDSLKSKTMARFCSLCGQRTRLQRVPPETRAREVCVGCGLVHYDNPKVLVAAILYWHHEIVLCRRASEPAKGRWTIPMGFLETGETLEEAVAREVEEETGLLVPAHALALYALCSLPHIDQVHVVYRAKLTSLPTPAPGDECLEVKLFSETTLPFTEIAFADALRNPIHVFFQNLQRNEFPVTSMTVGAPESGN